eukprot:TRINITY_DN4271_c0_g1_i1.p1 TRINITY_DN4271_c0_g1~~TRINITY_DN4271_c0_g1_i1.p1  ORF type:complete len:403 (-),score=98.64 TRINITY_DN4271_c0_g1_i1:327-1535(-)
MSATAAKEPSFNAEDFGKRLKAVREETRPTKEEEERHLAKLELWTTTLGVVGLVFAVRGQISFLAMLALGFYKYAKFAILAHHSLHGGWGRSRRGWYANGVYRRVVDWMDWIFPAAWIMEHNKIHHYRLNEDADPDYVQRNTTSIQESDESMPKKYLWVFLNMLTWKWAYYASNTLKTLHADEKGVPAKAEFDEPLTMPWVLKMAIQGDPWYRALAMDFIGRVMALPFLIYFVAIPVLAGCLSGNFESFPFCWAAFINVAFAEMITNVHAFCTIVTNHAGSDLWWFQDACKADSPEFFLRAVLGSSAYPAGNDFVDYYHGYLNYQGEHHAFPDLSPLHYQRLHPRFKQVCADFGVPYVQENIVKRSLKTIDIIVGKSKHKCLYGQAVDQPAMWSVATSKKID